MAVSNYICSVRFNTRVNSSHKCLSTQSYLGILNLLIIEMYSVLSLIEPTENEICSNFSFISADNSQLNNTHLVLIVANCQKINDFIN